MKARRTVTEPPVVLMSCHTEEVPIKHHPYFAARTKRGKPYKRRQRVLRRLLDAGLRTYLVPVITRTH